MEWTAEKFLERVLTPRRQPPWWMEHQSERGVEDALIRELSGEVVQFRAPGRDLAFFSRHGISTIDGRVGNLGVEMKYTHLGFEGVIDGSIHRGVTWVLGNPSRAAGPEAVPLHVVKPKSPPVGSAISDALVPVLGSLADLGIHVVFVNSATGDHWRALPTAVPGRIPNWLASKDPPAARLPNVQEHALALLDVI